MATFSGLAGDIDGLYRDLRTGTAYRRQDLSSLPTYQLRRGVSLQREAPGVYLLTFEGEDAPAFRLYSRRRSRR